MDYKEILIQSLTIGTANGGKFEFFFVTCDFILNILWMQG